MRIEWLGHDGFRILGKGVTIYIDPYKIAGGAPADIVLVTHGHFDHLSAQDIRKVSNKDTVLICSPSCNPTMKAMTMKPGDSTTVKGVAIEAVPAYNVNKKFHPQADQNVGYVVTVEGQRIYHAGDTDHIPEMANIQCDIALLPVSGTYVMTAQEAAAAAKVIKPKLAIPMHYGAGVAGTAADAQQFASLLKDSGIKVEIMEKA